MILCALFAFLSLFIWESIFGKLFWFVFSGFLSLGMYSREISPIGFIDDSLTEIGQIFGKKYINPLSKTDINTTANPVEYENYDPTVEFDNISISSEISDEVDNTPFIQNLGLSEDLKIKIKKILSDPNPDPENKNQTAASSENFNCKWCSKEYSHATSNYISIQALLREKLFDGSSIYMTWMSVSFDESGNVEVSNEEKFLKYSQLIEKICNFYDIGNKYTTYNVDPFEFCSEKCKTDYKYNH